MSDQDQTQATGGGQAGAGARQQAERPDGGGAAGRERGSGGAARHGRRGRHSRPPQQQGQQQARGAEPSLNMEELRELAELFTSHGLTDFEFENAEIRVRLSRNANAATTPAAGAPAAALAQASAQPAASQTAATTGGSSAAPEAAGQGTGASAATGAARAVEKSEDLHVITSPIVGTFFRAPAPNAEPFVRAGSHVEPDTVVCIIEAMKLMNEIQAETSGTVEKIYVENGQPVEYGQPLFGIKK